MKEIKSNQTISLIDNWQNAIMDKLRASGIKCYWDGQKLLIEDSQENEVKSALEAV